MPFLSACLLYPFFDSLATLTSPMLFLSACLLYLFFNSLAALTSPMLFLSARLLYLFFDSLAALTSPMIILSARLLYPGFRFSGRTDKPNAFRLSPFTVSRFSILWPHLQAQCFFFQPVFYIPVFDSLTALTDPTLCPSVRLLYLFLDFLATLIGHLLFLLLLNLPLRG